jgi:hypothetical protein
MTRPIGVQDRVRTERRGVILTGQLAGETIFAERVFDVLINETKGTEHVLWRSKPTMRLEVTAQNLIAEYTAAKVKCDPEEILMYDGFIESLQED